MLFRGEHPGLLCPGVQLFIYYFLSVVVSSVLHSVPWELKCEMEYYIS
jgi:hypothetical protein